MNAADPPLTTTQWAATAGLTPEWMSVLGAKEARMFRGFHERVRALKGSCRGDELSVLKESAARLRAAKPATRRELGRSPAFDSLVSADIRGQSDWIAAASTFAAAAAALDGESGEVPLWVAPHGSSHLSPIGMAVGFPASTGHRLCRLRLRRGRIAAAAGARVHSYAVVGTGLLAEHTDPLLARLHRDPKELGPTSPGFLATAAAAVEAIARVEPATAAEFKDLVRLLVPLTPPGPETSISSSYGTARGAIFLSHHDRVPLQFETLIHEFSHQKIEVLHEVDPLLIPGQDNAVFYSPWRPDPRPLRGLLLGAHAFINVMWHYQFLSRAMPVEREFQRELDFLACLRAQQCRTALETLSRRSRPTEFGGRFTLHLWRDLARIEDRLAGVTSRIRRDALITCRKHRREYGLPSGDLHRGRVPAASKAS